MNQLIELSEQEPATVLLTAMEARELRDMKFQVFPEDVGDVPIADTGAADGPVPEPLRRYVVNPGSAVGHFRLLNGVGRTVRIVPKVGIRNVFSLLAASYSFYSGPGKSPFRKENVSYDVDRTQLLEPLVERFIEGVRELLQGGLLATYVEREDNRPALRGRLVFAKHIAHNLVRQERLYCRYFQSEVDIPENQIVLWTLILLNSNGSWSPSVRRALRTDMLRFGGVTIREFLPRQSPAFHYDRLNSRYRDVHSWCRFFIDLLSLSDKSGSRPFHAYLLDMNVLFERFVISIFERAQTFVPLVAVQHHKSYPLTTNGTLQVCPDVTLKGPNNLQIAVDAKYKRTNGNTAKHPDLYQVVSYCTSLGLIGQDATPMQGILVYPSDQRTSELDGVLKVITSKGGSSELSIRVLWLDLASENVVSEAIKSFIVVLRGMTIPDVT